MAEAMIEVVLPDYFKKFQPNFKFVITEKNPNLSTFKNYAFGSHFKSEYCPFSVGNEKKTHYHILIQIDSEEQLNQFFPSQKCFSVPCIFTCFKYLVSPAKDVKGNGELFDKLKLALTYSAQPVAANLDLLDFTAIKKRLPNLLLSATSSNKQTSPNQKVCKKSPAVGGQKRIDNTITPAASSTSNKSARISTSVSKKHTESRHVQTDEMKTETLKRFESLINGPHSAAFCKIIDILTSGYGKLDVDTDVLFVKFIVEEKVKF